MQAPSDLQQRPSDQTPPLPLEMCKPGSSTLLANSYSGVCRVVFEWYSRLLRGFVRWRPRRSCPPNKSNRQQVFKMDSSVVCGMRQSKVTRRRNIHMTFPPKDHLRWGALSSLRNAVPLVTDSIVSFITYFHAPKGMKLA